MKENYAKRHRAGTQADDHPANLDDGPLTSPGAHSLKGDADRQAAEDEAIRLALASPLLPPTWNAEKALQKIQTTEVKRAEASLMMKLSESFNSSLEKHLPLMGQAFEDYFEKLNPNDDSKEALAVREHFRRNFVNQEMLDKLEATRSKKLAEDYDFQQFRVYKRGHDYQQRMMLSKHTVNAAMAGRRAGKTEGNQLLAGSRLVQPDKRVLIICLTYETASQLYWHPILKLLDDMGTSVQEKEARSGRILTAGGSILQLAGNSTADEREKLRGGKWDLIIIDEVQSQKALPYLIHDVCEPMLLDRKGQIWLTGTGPRVRGTMWESLWTEGKGVFRLNWDISDNPFIPDYETVLDKICAEKGITRNDPLFIREYRGQIAYDDDALVVRLKDDNFFDDLAITQWLQSQPLSDVHFIGGLDYGHSDHDAFCIILYSDSSPVNWVVYQYKMNLEGIAELASGIRSGILYVREAPIFSSIPIDSRQDFYVFADSSDGRASSDLSTMLGINIFAAYKHDKAASIDFLQDDVRRGWLKLPRSGDDGTMTPLEDEALKTLFLRDDRDNLTRELDDDTYHADMIPAVIYALKSGPWSFRAQSRD